MSWWSLFWSRTPAPAAPASLAASTGAGDKAAAPSHPFDGDPVVMAPFLKISRRYVVDNMSPKKLRDLQRNADLGVTEFFAELLDDVAADAQITTLLNVAKLAVAGAPICIDTGEDSEAALAIAADCEAFLKRIPDFRQLLIDLLEAEYRGFAAVQPEWVAEGGKWFIVGWESFESRMFRFPTDGETPELYTERAPGGEPLPEGVLFYRVRQRPGPIMRGGIGWSIAKPWLYKGFCLVDGMSFLERFGHPHVQVELPPNAVEGSQELEMARNAAKSLIVDQVGLVPPGVQLKILDNVNKAGTVRDVYLAFIEWCDAAMAKAFLGQSSSTDDQKSEGSQAKAKAGLQVKGELTAQRAERLCDFINKNIITPWARYHYGPKAVAPIFRLAVEPPVDEKSAAEVEKTQAETAKVLGVDLGLPLSRKQLYGRHKLRPPENAADAIGGVVAGAPNAKLGVCPGCGEVVSLAEAEKKKSLQDWAS